jgi:hypothetical protein
LRRTTAEDRSPCQGWDRGFESRRPLFFSQSASFELAADPLTCGAHGASVGGSPGPAYVRSDPPSKGPLRAGFSVLHPNTSIQPHVGYSEALLVAHLGLVISEGCAIRVGPEIRTWQPGKMLIFDDSTDHEAWNRGSTRRCVLLIEFLKPGHVLGEISMSKDLADSVDDLS